jgi:hypothetical protein
LSPAASTAVASRPAAGRANRTAARGRAQKRQAQRRPAARSERLLPAAAGGFLWAGAVCAATATSPLAAAAVVTPVGLVAGISAARAVSRQRRTRKPAVIAASTAALLTIMLPAAGLAGLGAAAGAAVLAAFLAAGVSFYVIASPRPWALAFAILGPAVACGSVVVAAGQGWNFGLTLVGTVCAYDFACWVNGTRRGAGGWGGVVAGLLTVGAAALFVAAVFVPPFSGWRPWGMLGLLGVLCVAGVAIAGRVAGPERLPALRRIDSLILTGPVWVAGVSLVLHR